MTVSILVPMGGPACEWRERAWSWVQRHYSENHGDWELVAGKCSEPEWSKGAAVADAFSRSSGDVLVIADADSYTTPEAVRTAALTTSWAVPHGRVYRLNQRATELLYAGEPLRRGHTAREPYMGPAGGGILALTRAAYLEVGGVDERFRGWGGEDVSLAWALETLVGPYRRIGAPLHHLWHPHPAPNLRGSPESEALVARYKAARRSPELMLALVQERQESMTHSLPAA